MTDGAMRGRGGVDGGARQTIRDFRHRPELGVERLRYLSRYGRI